MSSTPQDNSRSTYSQSQPSRHVFQAQLNLPTPSPPQQQQQQHQQRATFRQAQTPAQTQGGIRPPQHKSPYSTPFATANGQVQAGASRQNGNAGVSAEQQIAQGVLSNASSGSGSNTPQRRPPPLGTTIHISSQNQPMNIQNVQNQPMSVNHAINPTSSMSQDQNRSQNASPSLAAIQTPIMNASPGNSTMSRTQNGSPDDTQDLSMIDPQLAIDQQLSADPNTSMLDPSEEHEQQPVIQGDMLSAPPGGSYPTFEALFSHAQSHALAHGYAFVIGRSKRDNRGLKKVFLICDRGGTNKEKIPGEQRQRKTKSRKCGCTFGVFGLETKTAWILRGRIDGENLTHNHPPSESPTEHPGARKLDPKAIAAVKALEENGVSVKETLEILHRESPGVRYLPRDIYNARAAIKRDPSRVEATAMEQLPTFYKKPPMTFEEKLRAELRTEVANAHQEVENTKKEWRKEVEELKEQLMQRDKQIQKFEMFIDLCNERVMVQRERLEADPSGSAAP